MVVGYFAPNLSYLGRVWTYLVLLDLPISIVSIGLAWQHSALAVAWLVVVGTLWWYVLGRGAEFAFRKLTDSMPPMHDLIPR